MDCQQEQRIFTAAEICNLIPLLERATNMFQPTPTSRRYFLKECGIGLGKMAAAGLLTNSLSTTARGDVPPALTPRSPHFPAKAKAVIHLFMAGAPSQLDLFTEKPELANLEGKPLPASVIGNQRYAFIRPDAAVMGSRFQFARHGESGASISSAMPFLSQIADDVCFINSVTTDQFNHAPAQIFFNTGFSQPGRPTLGAWALYGLGAETQNLPAYIVMSTGSGLSGGSALWSSGFLPTIYTGTRFRSSGPPILNVQNPPGVSETLQRETFDFLNRMNSRRLEATGDTEIATRIASFEMASQLQTSAPELTDLTQETAATFALYGCDPQKPSFARSCLMARRMVERGVRFVSLFHEGWDAHSDVEGNTRHNCAQTDQATAALISDLKQRGLLDETLVIWGGEFGRTPMVETNPALGRALGRDHHPQAYTMWLAGGGIKAGMSYGQTDDFGFHITENPVHVHDLQATILHCLGFDHERLTHHYAGRDFRLTDVHGRVVHEILS